MRSARWIFLAVLGGCGGTTATAPGKPAPAIRPAPPAAAPVDQNPIVAARVDGVSILTWDVDRHLDAATKARIKETADPGARDALRTKERRRVLADMIDRQLFLAAAMAHGISSSREEIEAALVEIRAQNNLSEAQLTEAITTAGFGTLDDYRKELGEQIQVLRFLAQAAPPSEPRDVATRRISAELRARAKIAIALPEPPAAAPALEISGLLTVADLASTLGHALPTFETGPLEHDDATADYASWHFKAVGEPESHDVAFRVWRLGPKELQARWDQLHTELPDVHDESGLADASFRASGSDVFGRVFLDRKASLVMLVTCGASVCTSADQALALAKLLHARQGRLRPR